MPDYPNKAHADKDLEGTWQLSKITQADETIQLDGEENEFKESPIALNAKNMSVLGFNDESIIGFGKQGNRMVSTSGYFMLLEETTPTIETDSTERFKVFK